TQELLAAPAVEDLRARRPADGGTRAASHRHDRLVEVRERGGIGGRDGRHEAAVTDVATGPGTRRRLRRIPEVTQDGPPPAGVALDVSPDLAILAPAGAGALLDRGAAERLGAAVEGGGGAPGHSVRRGRRGRQHARAREM